MSAARHAASVVSHTAIEGAPPPVERRVHRALFSAITPDALSAAFRALGRPEAVPDAALSRSVDARQELDLRVGVALTRLLSWRCVGAARRRFAPSTKLVSYGPCQTPTLHFCVERAREIEAFESRAFWTVAVHVAAQQSRLALRWLPHTGTADGDCDGPRDDGQEEVVDGRRTQLPSASTFDQSAARRVVERLRSCGALRVASVTEVAESRHPPEGLNTVRLLVAGSKAMAMSPKQVMKTAESLYSQGFISYPRTGALLLTPWNSRKPVRWDCTYRRACACACARACTSASAHAWQACATFQTHWVIDCGCDIYRDDAVRPHWLRRA